jgi:hypothetical protein
MAAPPAQLTRLNELLAKWKKYRAALPEPDRYCQIKSDLYQVRNPGWNGCPPISVWPPDLVDPDDAMNAAVEHYFLCRCWIGTGKFPSWQLRTMNNIYDLGKAIGVTPAHNPNKPPSKLTLLQMSAKEASIRDGEADMKKAGGSAPWIAKPPTY